MKYVYSGYSEIDNESVIYYECEKIAKFTGGGYFDYWYIHILNKYTTGMVELEKPRSHLVIKKYVL